MKKHTLILLFSFICFISISSAQNLAELFERDAWSELAAYAPQADSLPAESLVFVGAACYQLDSTDLALQLYEMAIDRGEKTSYVHYLKGLALRSQERIESAIPEFQLASERDPLSQVYRTEVATSYFLLRQYDSALVHYRWARDLDYEMGDAYLQLPVIYHMLEKYPQAIEEYQKSAEMIPEMDPMYLDILANLGQLAYGFEQDYPKSARAYEEILRSNPADFESLAKLVKTYHSMEAYAQADSLFSLLQGAFRKRELPDYMMENKAVVVGEFAWEGKKCLVVRHFEIPVKTLGYIYELYLMDDQEDKVLRRLMTEKTIQFGDDGTKHLLCEEGEDGTHYTFTFGWATDDIPYEGVKAAAIRVFTGTLQAGASSRFSAGTPTEESKGKKKKKRKKRKRD